MLLGEESNGDKYLREDRGIGVMFRDTKERGGESKEVVVSVDDSEDGLSWCRSGPFPWGDDLFS